MPKLPQIKGDRLVNALSKRGWHVDHTQGSHVIMRHESPSPISCSHDPLGSCPRG
ncbi:MAG: addiction module toxin, HicA family [Chloroflexi bacterium]|nr:addiction module toxin, HicA family [Chloroflexota bacterium]